MLFRGTAVARREKHFYRPRIIRQSRLRFPHDQVSMLFGDRQARPHLAQAATNVSIFRYS